MRWGVEGAWAGTRLALAAVLPLACYAAVLAMGAPASLRLDSAVVAAGFGVSLLLAFSRPGGVAASVACALTLTLFALPLSALWQSGVSNSASIGGLLPYSDANGYYHCARVLAEGDTLRSSPWGGWCSRRPLFTAALAGWMALTGQDLRLTLAVLVLLTALACFLAAREVRASHGATAAALFLLTLSLFYRRFSGTTLTEHLGLSLGAVGFAALWRGVRGTDFRLFLVGLLALTVALNARAGALLVLPAIAVWGSGWFPGSARAPWRRLALACGVILLGFVVNAGLVRGIGRPEGMFSNFSYTLYGLVFGGNWTLVFTQHPSIKALGDEEQARRVLALALEGIGADPMRLVHGTIRAWQSFLATPYPFIYVEFTNWNLSLRILSLVGLVGALVRWRDPLHSFVLAASLGGLLSVPFAPPWDADHMRVYAATIPLLAVVPALGIAWLTGRLPKRNIPAAVPGHGGSWSAALPAFAIGLVALPLVSPVALGLLRDAPRFPSVAASDCNQPIYVRAPTRSMVSVVRDDAPGRRYPFELGERQFREGLRDFRELNRGLTTEFAGLEAPFVLFNSLTLQPFGYAMVVARAPLVPDPRSGAPFWLICAEPASDPMARDYSLVYATSVRPIWPLPAK